MGNCSGKNTYPDFDERLEFCGGNVSYIADKESWDEKIAEANKEGKTVLANFSATWCAPCRVIAPWFGDQSVKYPSLCFLIIDVDEFSELSTSMDVRVTPTFIFLKDGRQLSKVLGANKVELEKKFAFYASSLA